MRSRIIWLYSILDMPTRRDKKEEPTNQPVRVLVTGANGFVGNAIAQRCLLTGMDVRMSGRSDKTSTDAPGYFKADITDPDSLLEAMSDVDCVVHAAGLAHQFGEKIKPSAFMKTNVNGSRNVASTAISAGVKHLVLISSVSVYGPHGKMNCDEDTTCQPVGPYAESKYQAEKQTSEIVNGSDTRLTILRLSTVYGEGDPGNVARLMRMIDRGRFVWVGDGSNRKSLIDKDDVALACEKVIHQTPDVISTYNVSTSVNSMREIVEALAAELGKGLPRWRIPSGLAKTMASSFDRISGRRKQTGRFGSKVDKWLGDDVYDSSRFNRKYDFASTVSLTEGLKREVDWYRHIKGIH